MTEELDNTSPAESESDFDMDSALESVEDGLGLTDTEEGEETEAAPAASEKDPAKPDTSATEPAAGQPVDDRFARAPDTWRPDAIKSWETIPPEVRAEIYKREDDIRQGLAAARDHTEVGSGLERLLSPYSQILTNYGVNPWDHLSNLLSTHATLMFGKPEQKASIINNLIEQTGLDRQKLAAGEPAPYNAEQQALMREVQFLRSQVSGVVSQVSESRLQELEGQIADFASKPENSYFWKVVPEIQRLMQQNPNMTLAAAYQDAVMLNPITRAAEIDRITRERAEKEAKEAGERTKAARRATAVNVRSREGGRPAPTSDDWEDTLKDTLADIRARQ